MAVFWVDCVKRFLDLVVSGERNENFGPNGVCIVLPLVIPLDLRQIPYTKKSVVVKQDTTKSFWSSLTQVQSCMNNC